LLLIPTEDLKLFFLTEGEAQFMEDSDSVNVSIGKYLEEFAVTNEIPLSSISIWFHIKKDVINIMAFEDRDFVQTISLKSLIKYFKK